MSNPEGKGGFQERPHHINRKGRPKSFDELRALAQSIAHEPALDANDNPIVINGKIVTLAEALLRKMTSSKDTRRHMQFLEIAFGKVPLAMDVSVDKIIFEVIRGEAKSE